MREKSRLHNVANTADRELCARYMHALMHGPAEQLG